MGTFTGGAGDESYVGTADPDQATGGGGADVLVGLGGGDRLDGESGDDSLDGGNDDDVLIGGAGADDLVGGAGSDQLFSDAIDPNFGGFVSSPGVSLDKGASADFLDGGAGDDYLFAGYGDSVDGGTQDSYGDRLFISFLASPTGVNADFRPMVSNNNATLVIGGATIAHIESVDYLEGSEFDDVLAPIGTYYPNPGASTYGRGGNDLIIGNYYTGIGSGGLYGGDGNDTIDVTGSGYGGNVFGDAGDDTLLGGGGFARLSGGDGNDTISLRAYGGIANGGAGNDVITDGDGFNTINGDDGNDRITGGGDRDQIDGGAGDDLIYGDYGPNGTVTAYYPPDDTITGGAGADTIYGDDGNDTIDGGTEDDNLFGGAGNDAITAGSGNDSLDGGSGDDSLYGNDGDDLLKSGAGVDQLSGEIGNDRLYFGGSFAAGDLAAGGSGIDALILQGDYSAGVSLTGSNAIGIETLRLLSAADDMFGGASAGASFSYGVTVADAVTPAGATLSVDAAGLAGGEMLTFNGAAETNGRFNLTGGAGNDDLTGGAGDDSFLLDRGGADRAVGGGGSDGFFFGAALTAGDAVDGGAGIDTVAIQGDYSAGLGLPGIGNVEVLLVLSGSSTQFGGTGANRYSYSLTSADSTVANGATLTVQATSLLADESLTFNGSPEFDGGFRIFAGRGNDWLVGGNGSDGFFFGSDGNFSGADHVDGGGGIDSIGLRGNYAGAGALQLSDATFTNVEVLALLSGHSNEYGGVITPLGYDYDVTLADGNVAAGQMLDLNGGGLRSDETMRVDGRAETDGAFRIIAGAGDDTLLAGAGNDIVYGGAGNDTLGGGLGKDRLEGGAGADTYVYASAAESTSTGYDLIVGFDWQVDRIDVPGSTARTFSHDLHASLFTAGFDANMADALVGVLGAGEAAIVHANGGDLAGHVFAVIDLNGAAGYQAGQDLVIELAFATLPIDPAAGVIV